MKRNYGLDLLKIVSMIMIISLHYLGKGGGLYHTTGIYMYICYAIEALAFVSVNTFVLVSGYFSSDNNEINYKKITQYLFQLWIINFVISLVIMVLKVYPFEPYDYIYMFFPFFSKANWFLNCYIFLYLLHPYINKVINHCNEKEHKTLLIILIIIMSIIPTITSNNNFIYDISRGYSISWFITLYLISSYIKKYYNDNKSSYFYIFIYLVCSMILPVYKYVANTINIEGFLPIKLLPNLLYNYSSIPVLLASISLFLLFRRINIRTVFFRTLIKFNVPLVLGVYLIHEQIFLRQILWIDFLKCNKYYNKPVMFLHMACVVFGLYFVCSLLEWSRNKILTFNKKENAK